jgi:glycosyltransferase involved in cell wall biosynthesis
VVRAATELSDRATVAQVSLDGPLRPVELKPGHEQALLVAIAGGSVVGEVIVAGSSPIGPELQREALAGAIGERLWRRTLTELLRDSVRTDADADRQATAPSVSVVICTRDRPQDLDRCLHSLATLATDPHEVLVVDNTAGDASTADVCARHAVRRVVEPEPGLSRARNRGIAETTGAIVAFTDDDCVVDPGWLDVVPDAFADPRVMVLAGYVGPLELETPAQTAFERLGGFARAYERKVLDGRTIRWAGIGDGNSFFRRDAFEEVGLFAEDLGPGSPALSGQDADMFSRIFAAGYRMVLDPGAIVWHRHRPDHAGLRSAMFGYSAGFSAYVARSLIGRRDPRALRYGAWWPRHVASHAIQKLRGAGRVPADVLLAEAAGTLVGPWRLRKGRQGRNARPSIEPNGSAALGSDGSPGVTEAAGPELSVVIASRNRRELLTRTLRALERQTYPADRFEVLVILDGSTDDSADAVQGLSTPYRLRVLEQEHRGAAVTRNRALREVAHPLVVFLDDDIVPAPEFLAAHADAHATASDRHLALGYYPPATADRSFWAIELQAWWEDYFRRKTEPNHQWTFMDLSEGNSSIHRDVLLDAGGFDEDFTGGRRQDWELGARLLERGVRFAHYPRARGSHFLDTSFATALRNAREEGRWDVVLASKHPGLKHRLHFSQFARAEGGTMSRRGRLAYRYPEAAGRLAEAMVPVLAGLERRNLQRQWRELSWLVLAQEYIGGVASQLPTVERLREFVSDVDPDGDAATMSLVVGGPAPASASPLAPVDVEARCGSLRLARTRAPALGEQWDWEALVDRLVEGSPRSPSRELLECVAGHLPPGTSEVLRAWRGGTEA